MIELVERALTQDVDAKKFVAALFEQRRNFAPEMLARVSMPDRTGVWSRLLAETFIDLISASILSNSWDTACDWVDQEKLTNIDRSTRRRLLVVAIRMTDALCSSLVDESSPALAEVRLRLRFLEKIMFGDPRIPWRMREEMPHDPIDVAVDSIIRSLDAKDEATGEHSRAVSAWGARVALKMDLSDDDILMVMRGGMIHDVGKTTVPSAVLNAPRKLNDEEWRMMQNHVIAGYEMVSRIGVLHEYHFIVRNHHERFQGGGYPDGLIKEEIPVTTRIVTVVDSFNAMIGRRPYRPALSPLTAVEELLRHRGTQFDPDATDAMAEIVYEMELGRKTLLPEPSFFEMTHWSDMVNFTRSELELESSSEPRPIPRSRNIVLPPLRYPSPY